MPRATAFTTILSLALLSGAVQAADFTLSSPDLA